MMTVLATVTLITSSPTETPIDPPYLVWLTIERDVPQPDFDFMGELQHLYV